MQTKWLIWTMLITLSAPQAGAQNLWPPDHPTLHIDSVSIRKNWRTKDEIILKELGIRPGTDIDKKALDIGITRIWNIGNFSDVQYALDTLEGGRILLRITAKDAFTIVPILSFSGNKKDFKLTAGVSDHNFLGRNLRLSLLGSYGSNVTDFSLSVTIPRQLLYKNMSIHSSVVYGHNQQYRYRDEERISGTGYEKKEIAFSMTNPWHRDFKYTFSPDLGISYFQHTTDSALIPGDIPFAGNYKINYLKTTVSESVGYVKRMRHQRDGYLVSLTLGGGIGLDRNSPSFLDIELSGAYYKLFNHMVQFSAQYETGYTTSHIPSLLFYKGNREVKGIVNGEISGQAYYIAYIGGHFTYLNRNWFALEQSIFLNWGNGSDQYSELYTTAPLTTVGTGISLMIPMIPWLYVRFYFTWTRDHHNWFTVEF